MTTTQSIPLNRLFPSDANVRRTGRTDGIEGLAASIAAHGLRQNLNVLPREDGKRYEVVAGGRRLRALKQLAKTGQLAKDAPISCLVLAEGDDPGEISLAENTLREAMHPDDQCEAFRALIEERQATVEEVAARFGVTAAMVRQRLKLAAVSPKLRTLYRKGGMTLDHMMALAISDDHAAQEAAWQSLPDWNRDPASLKRALTEGTIALSDRLALFVSVEAYQAAGGTVVRDLFDGEDSGYLADAALVQRLALDKMEAVLDTLRAEGWKWAKAELSRDYRTDYGRVWPQDGGGDEEDEDRAETADAFTPEDMARAGALVRLGPDGSPLIERGLVHPDDRKAEKAARSGRNADPTALAASMVTDLSAHRTAALRVELARNPAVALAATVHALALPLLYGEHHASCLALRASSEALERHTKAAGDSPAHRVMAEVEESWVERLPEHGEDLFAWCLAQPQEVLLDLLAFAAAMSVDALETKQKERSPAADRLADALSLDMRSWWTPSVEGFYQRLPKAALIHAMSEAKVDAAGVPLASVKKAEAARLVAKAMQDTGWLPAPLRMPVPDAAAAA